MAHRHTWNAQTRPYVHGTSSHYTRNINYIVVYIIHLLWKYIVLLHITGHTSHNITISDQPVKLYIIYPIAIIRNRYILTSFNQARYILQYPAIIIQYIESVIEYMIHWSSRHHIMYRSTIRGRIWRLAIVIIYQNPTVVRQRSSTTYGSTHVVQRLCNLPIQSYIRAWFGSFKIAKL